MSHLHNFPCPIEYSHYQSRDMCKIPTLSTFPSKSYEPRDMKGNFEKFSHWDTSESSMWFVICNQIFIICIHDFKYWIRLQATERTDNRLASYHIACLLVAVCWMIISSTEVCCFVSTCTVPSSFHLETKVGLVFVCVHKNAFHFSSIYVCWMINLFGGGPFSSI